jgi:hypothetical protein
MDEALPAWIRPDWLELGYLLHREPGSPAMFPPLGVRGYIFPSSDYLATMYRSDPHPARPATSKIMGDGTSYQYDLGAFGRTITTSSPKAQTWFNRGFVWSYAFHHEESARCFHRAIDDDPSCSMAYWGVGGLHQCFVNCS